MKSTVLNELMNCSVIELAQYSSVIAARLSSIDVNGGKDNKVISKSSKNTNDTNKTNDKDKYAIKHDITPKFIVEDKVVKLDGFYGKKAFQAIKELILKLALSMKRALAGLSRLKNLPTILLNLNLLLQPRKQTTFGNGQW